MAAHILRSRDDDDDGWTGCKLPQYLLVTSLIVGVLLMFSCAQSESKHLCVFLELVSLAFIVHQLYIAIQNVIACKLKDGAPPHTSAIGAPAR